MKKHLVFYDGTCGLCDHFVQWILKVDRKQCFVFAPLQGETAARILHDLPMEMRQNDSLVLVEDYLTENRHFFVLSKAALRICWLLGGIWKIVGILSFLPAFFFDWAYRWVARHRHRLFSGPVCALPNQEQKDRFLP